MDVADALFNHLDGAVLRSIRRQNSLAIAASGGLDSSILAALIAQHADIPVHLLTAAAPGSPDAKRARLLARHLGFPLTEIVLTRATVERLLGRLAPLLVPEPVDPDRRAEWGLPPDAKRVSPIRAAVGIVLLACAEEASHVARRMVVGQGADEFFAGYARYHDLPREQLEATLERDRASVVEDGIVHEKRIADNTGMQFHYPYLDPGVRAFAQGLLLDSLLVDGARKPLLRAVAKRLRLPSEIVDVPKTAAQYGSGVGLVLAELARATGLPQNDFLTQFVDGAHRTMGEDHSLRT